MSKKPEALSVGLDAIVGRCLEVAKDGRWLPGTLELQMVQALAGQRDEIERLRAALAKIERMPWPDSQSPYALIAREALTPNE